jgi:transcription elongation factor Elf1
MTTLNRYAALTKRLTCPFCGSTPIVEPWHGGGPEKTAVHCVNDGCPAQPMVTGPRLAIAVDRWNTRRA